MTAEVATRPTGRGDPDAPGTLARRWPRAVLMVPAGMSLFVGLDAALLLLGLPAPVRADRLPEVHGMVQVFGFVGILVALERAVALRRTAGFVAPLSLGGGSLLLLSPLGRGMGGTLLVLGAVALTAVYVPLWRRTRDDAVLVQALGAVLATSAALLYLGGLPVSDTVPWMAGFVVLTIAGERLELARLGVGSAAGPVLVLASAALVGAVLAVVSRTGTDDAG